MRDDLSKSSMRPKKDIGEASLYKKELISVWAGGVTTKIGRRVAVLRFKQAAAATGDLNPRLTDLAIFVNTKVMGKSPCRVNNIFIVY